MTTEPDDNHVPVSVRLGEVVPPEDPEDWTRPLTWVVALGMLAGPLVALGWFVLAPPSHAIEALPGTYIVATAIAAGAVVTGATQQGAARAATATLGSALFAGLVVVMLGVVMAGGRQVESASPTVAHAFTASLDGFLGALVAAAIAGLAAGRYARGTRTIAGLVPGVGVSVVAVWTLHPW